MSAVLSNTAQNIVMAAISLISVIGIRHGDMISSITDGLSMKDFTMVIAIEGWGFIFYCLFLLLNFVTGLQAASYENRKRIMPRKSWIRCEYLYRTLWKTLGILFLTTMIAGLALLLIVMEYRAAYYTALWFLIVFWLLAAGYEFYSCGENIERRNGKKPHIFALWDKILAAIEKLFMKKLDNI